MRAALLVTETPNSSKTTIQDKLEYALQLYLKTIAINDKSILVKWNKDYFCVKNPIKKAVKKYGIMWQGLLSKMPKTFVKILKSMRVPPIIFTSLKPVKASENKRLEGHIT